MYGEADWGREWAGFNIAAPSFTIQSTEVEDSEVQRPSGPELQPSVSEEPSAGQRWKLEAQGRAPRMKANHKSWGKVYTWKTLFNLDVFGPKLVPLSFLAVLQH